MLLRDIINNRIEDIIKRVFSLEIEVKIENSKLQNVGDYSTNAAMVLSGRLKRPALEIADIIVGELSNSEFAEAPNATKPGFVNFRISRVFLRDAVKSMFSDFCGYTKIDIAGGAKYNIEFVSANPTGPLNVVNARAASTGIALANLLKRVGYGVHKEFYINDAGNQIEIFGNSVRLRYLELFGQTVEFPADHYQGDYVREIATEIKNRDSDRYLKLPEIEQRAIFKNMSKEIVIDWQRKTLEKYGVSFDKWYSENEELHLTGKVAAALESAKMLGLVYEADGAVWLKTKQFGDEKDRPLVRNNGAPTYFLSDIAYHKDKFERGADYLLDLWGPDHHGHIKRTALALKAMNLNADNFKVMIIQQVNFIDNGEQLKMSKRKGRIVTMDALMEEIPNDVSKFFFLMRNSDSHLDFDIELAKTESNENPVYYVQYAFARICSIFRKLSEDDKELDSEFRQLKQTGAVEFVNLGEPEEESELIKTIAVYPEEIINSAKSLQPHRLVNYIRKLAGDFHSYYNKYSVLNCENKRLKIERLALAECCRRVIKDALEILNINSPEKM